MGRCIYLRKGEVHTPPVVGVKAGDLPIGQIVKLMEDGVETEFIVVNQGIPENSSLYDASCNGTWLLKRKCNDTLLMWNSTKVNIYDISTINTWLNDTYFNTLGSIEQAVIKEVKIPYCVGNASSTVNSGANGLSTKIFLIGGYELGFTTSVDSNFPIDGARCSYFENGVETSAKNKRIAYFVSGNVVNSWWTRSPTTTYSGQAKFVTNDGNRSEYYVNTEYAVRPCLIIPSTSIFDGKTYTLLGGQVTRHLL